MGSSTTAFWGATALGHGEDRMGHLPCEEGPEGFVEPRRAGALPEAWLSPLCHLTLSLVGKVWLP